MLSLYELEQQYRLLVDEYSDTPDDVEAWNVLLDEITGSIDVKVTNIAMVVKQLEAEEKAIADEVARLQEKKKARSAKVGRLKAYMLDGMMMAGIERTTDIRASVRVQNNPPSVRVVNEGVIPADYWVAQDPRLDKRAIADVLKTGAEVPGADLVQTKGVRIT